jgi:ubiquinone/menaquinone biosynthesis C-methylase UbiE
MAQVPAGHPEKPEGEDGVKMLERMNGGRHEELALWGLSFMPIGSADSLLDIGCGGGANIGRLLERTPEGSVVGVDYSPLSVEASRAYNAEAVAAGRCKVIEGDSAALPLPDDSFDGVTAFETVYYWDLPRAFAEVKRVLKPGGHFLACNEDDGSDPATLELAVQIPGMRVYSLEDLAAALEGAGLTVVTAENLPGTGQIAIAARA